jgi:hypothetical protein
MDNPSPESKNISCCELLTLFKRYYQKKFGVDGMVLFNDEMENEELNITYALTKSLFNYLGKNNKLCEKCDKGWKNLLKQ